MKKRLFTALIFFLFVSGAKAQGAYITDPFMVNWFSYYYPNSMTGPWLDTTNLAIINEDTIKMTMSHVVTLSGIKYFVNATVLIAENNEINNIPAFPPNLKNIEIAFNEIAILPTLPNGLIRLKCFENNLTQLPVLPSTLEFLACGNNNLSSLPTLPNSLTQLYCNENYLTSLPSLPNSLEMLDCRLNDLNVLPVLPISLTDFDCGENNLTTLPSLPNMLRWLNVSGNVINSFPVLPDSLKLLGCSYCNLSFLPVLPTTLEKLYCSDNNLTVLSALPNTLVELNCENNNLTVLPDLAMGLNYLYVGKNHNLGCLPLLPEALHYLSIDSTSILCLPNYPSSLILLGTPLSGFPLCQPNNPNSCLTTTSISGAVFQDISNTCINNANLPSSVNFHLYDNQNNLLQSRSSSNDNNYYFSILPGQYSVQVDSSFLPSSVSITCPISVVQSVSAVQDSSYTDRDFGFNCTGTDLGVQAIVHQGIVFPGQPHSVKAIAGDLSNYFGLNCAAGTGGTVQLNINGPVTYSGFPATSLAPSVSGNTYLYTIVDFATTNLQQSFVLNFLTDTTAQAGDSITVTATIISDSVDLDSTNNTLSYTYIVVNSYDPNMKEVNPVDVLPGYEDYFTYTVHFQNLGSAPAFNIRIKDTLDGNLDLKTLRVINASHNYSFNLTDDLLTVYFQNIMLADSASNPEGSKGFVQYQVKPKANLPLGTLIENTAHIFFDFNEAVVTNTTTNKYVEKTILPSVPLTSYSIHPNPSSGNITIVNKNIGNEMLNVRIHDLMGKSLVNEGLNFKNGVSSLNTDLVSGSYFLVIENGAGVLSSYRLVIRK